MLSKLPRWVEVGDALHLALIVLAFLVGAIASGVITGNATLQLGRRYGAALLLEAVLLARGARARRLPPRSVDDSDEPAV